MESTKPDFITIFRAMSRVDKLLAIFFAVAGILLVANGLYLVGYNGLLIALGGIVLHVVTKIFRITEMEIITVDPTRTSNGKPGVVQPVGAGTNTNDELIPGIIAKRKRHAHQSLLDTLMTDTAAPEDDEEKARADHEFLVEMARKKQEAMRTAVSGPAADPSVRKRVIEKQEAYIKELMKPTIVPQRELANKTENEDKN